MIMVEKYIILKLSILYVICRSPNSIQLKVIKKNYFDILWLKYDFQYRQYHYSPIFSVLLIFFHVNN